MDANNTKYHLLLGERDWLPPLLEQSSPNMWWDHHQQGICLAPVINQLDNFSRETSQLEDRRRGAAFDHYGNVYWINEENNGIDYRPHATPHQAGEYWHARHLQHRAERPTRGDFCSAPDVPDVQQTSEVILRGLTVTSAGFLVVATLSSAANPPGLLVFDLHGGGPPTWLHWPVAINFAPLDMSCAPDGGLFILDRHQDNPQAQVWHLDVNFRLLSCNGDLVELLVDHSFYSRDSQENDHSRNDMFFSGTPIVFEDRVGNWRPIAIEALAENAFILLVSPAPEMPAAQPSRILYYLDGEFVDEVALDESVLGQLLPTSSIHGHDFAFLPETSTCRQVIEGRLFISSSEVAQAYELALVADARSLTLTLRPKLLPMRADTGKALIVSAATPYYDFGDRWLPLVEQPRREYVNEAALDQFVFDGEEPDCVWHRVIMEACIPEGAAVKVETRAANTELALVDAPWQREPIPYLRAGGPEIPNLVNTHEQSDHKGSWDLLLQKAQGRYLQLRLTLTGNKRVTPYVYALRLYYPRFSYLNRYLPALYQQDSESADFLDRFLANVEGLFTQLEDKIAHAEALFDTRTTPPEFLDWLGGWLGAFVDPVWDDYRKRLFIDNAVLLFQWRGTPAGLKALLKLAIDPCPDSTLFSALVNPSTKPSSVMEGQNIRIVEHFMARRLFQSLPALPEGELLQLPASQEWRPELGATELHQRFQAFLRTTYREDIAQLNSAWSTSDTSVEFGRFADIKFPPTLPSTTATARDWHTFTQHHLGFSYAPVSIADTERYQIFLRSRYQQIARLNAHHGLIGSAQHTSFSSITLPTQFPNNTTSFRDWMDFVSLALPIDQQAHRFSVLLPTTLGELPAAMESRRARVEQIVAREKPAHTQFDVKFFWQLFQVGSARLGIDSALGESSRFVAMVLGENFLGQSYLSASHPWSQAERSVLGRDQLSSGHQWRTLQ